MNMRKISTLIATASLALLGIGNSCYAQQGAALNFDGSNDIVDAGNAMNSVIDTMNVLTVEAWIYPTSTSGSYKTIVGNYSSPLNQMQFDLRLQQNSVVFLLDCGAGYQWAQTPANSVTLNTWQHVAGVWDGTNIIIYINGQLANSACCATGSSFVTTTNSVTIGGNNVPEMFNGSLDEIRIWTRALCQGEIQNNMNGELSLPQTNLLAYYQFNEGVAGGSNTSVTTLPDSSGNGYNGTVSNFALTGSTSNWITPGGVTSGVNAPAFVSPSISISGPSIIGIGSSATYTAAGNVATYTWSANAGNANTATVTVSPTVTTTYSVVGTNSVGCVSNTAVQTLSVNPLGAALNFDGTDDIVNAGNSMNTVLDTLNKITVEAWINPTSTTGSYKTIIGNYSSPLNEMQFDMRLQGNSVVFFVNCGAGYQFGQTPANSITLNTWQHIAGVWDGTNILIYINGTLANSACCATGSSFVTTTNSVVIGGNTVPEMFNGNLDEIRVWTRALCQGEIQNNMNGELALPQTGLLAYYQFNEGVAAGSNAGVTALPDVTGNGYNGTLSNFALTGTASNWVDPGGVLTGNNVTAYVAPTLTVTGTSTICDGSSTVLTASGADTYTWTAGPTTASYTVSPTTNTTYSVNGTSLGCPTSMAMVNVTVNPSPVISSQSGNVTACGDVSASFTINSAGTNTYQWYYVNTVSPFDSDTIDGSYTEINYTTDSMTIQQLITGQYDGYAVYCVVTNTANCSVTSAPDTITVNALPTITATASNDTICSGFSDTLNASGGLTYVWSSNAGSATTASVVITPTVTDIYTVTGSDANCSNTATVSIVVDNCGTGISGLAPVKVNIYPNPGHGKFILETGNSAGVRKIKVLNLLGAEVYARIYSNDPVIDLQDQQNGVYFVIVETSSGISTLKIIKE